MFRIAGIATGALLVSGSLLVMLKNHDLQEAKPIPSIKALANEWSACEEGSDQPECLNFAKQPAVEHSSTEQAGTDAETATQTETVALQKLNPEVLEDFNLPKKAVSEENQPVMPQTAASPEPAVTGKSAPAQEIQLESLEPEPVTDISAESLPPVTASKTPDKIENFEIESTSDLYDVDQRYGAKDYLTQEHHEPEWQVFWAPFQTETAAKGFAARIAKNSGVAIQVIRQDKLKYVVAFPYTSKEERLERAKAIEKAFGMKIIQDDWS